MTDRIVLYETMTGKPVAFPAVASYSWSIGLNDDEGSVEFETTVGEVKAEDTEPWKRSVAVLDEDDRVLAAGPIYKRDVDFDAGLVKITAGSFWSLVKKRVFQRSDKPILADNTHYWIATDGTRTDWRQSFVSTLGGIALDLIKSQFADLPGVASWPHPTGPHTRTYDGLELQTVADLARNLFDDQDPPTVLFGASLQGGRVVWDAQIIGETTSPRRFLFDLDADAGTVTGWKVTEDFGSAVNQAWLVSKSTQTGQGQAPENSSLFAQVTRGLAAGEPRLSVADSSHDGVTVGETLDSYAAGLAYSTPYMAFTLEIARNMRTGSVLDATLGDTIRPGDIVIMTTSQSFWGPSTFAGVATGISGDAFSMTVTVERVAHALGIVSQIAPAAGVQRPAGDASSRVKALEAFARRSGNPVTDKPGVPVVFTRIPLTMGTGFQNIDLTATRVDPMGLVVIEGTVTTPAMIVGGTRTVATMASDFPLTQTALAAYRDGSTHETIQSYVTAAGAIVAVPDPTFYAGNVLVFSGMYAITT